MAGLQRLTAARVATTSGAVAPAVSWPLQCRLHPWADPLMFNHGLRQKKQHQSNTLGGGRVGVNGRSRTTPARGF